MGEVAVHLEHELRAVVQRATEPGQVRGAQPPLGRPVEDGHPPTPGGEPVGERSGTVGGVVVDHEHAIVGAEPLEQRGDHRLEVLALVVRRQADQRPDRPAPAGRPAHAKCSKPRSSTGSPPSRSSTPSPSSHRPIAASPPPPRRRRAARSPRRTRGRRSSRPRPAARARGRSRSGSRSARRRGGRRRRARPRGRSARARRRPGGGPRPAGAADAHSRPTGTRPRPLRAAP